MKSKFGCSVSRRRMFFRALHLQSSRQRLQHLSTFFLSQGTRRRRSTEVKSTAFRVRPDVSTSSTLEYKCMSRVEFETCPAVFDGGVSWAALDDSSWTMISPCFSKKQRALLRRPALCLHTGSLSSAPSFWKVFAWPLGAKPIILSLVSLHHAAGSSSRPSYPPWSFQMAWSMKTLHRLADC